MTRPINKLAPAALMAAALAAAVPAAWLARVVPGAAPSAGPVAERTCSPGSVSRLDDDGTLAIGVQLASAQVPATGDNPARASGQAPVDGKMQRRGPVPDRPWGARPSEQRPLTPAEWTEIAAFMSGYMPWRIAEVERMPDGPTKERTKKLLATRYRGLRALQGRDVDSYEQRLGQLKIEDQVYKLVSEWGGADEAKRRSIRDELRTQVSRLVDVDLQERRRRVERLEDELRKQKLSLDQDTKDRENLIERRAGRFLDWAVRWPAQSADGNAPKPRRGTTRPGPAAPEGGSSGDSKAPADPPAAGEPADPRPDDDEPK